MDIKNIKNSFNFSGILLFILFFLLVTIIPVQADVTVTVSGPGGQVSQALPDAGGVFDVELPLNRNAVNAITVTATDALGNTAGRELMLTQVSLEQIVVSKVTSERLSVEEVEKLVADGVIDLEDPENYNVSTFNIVLTIAGKPVPISIPIAVPADAKENGGFENYRMPKGDQPSGRPDPPPIEIIVFDVPFPSPPSAPGSSNPSIPGVIIIEGNIKSLKEFFNVRLLLMNTSGTFTLGDVIAEIDLPEGMLSNVLPADGINSFGDILPGIGDYPGQKEKSFIIRGDSIGIQDFTVNFGGQVTGPGITDPIPFNGNASGQVEVKGPPDLKVQISHPDSVEQGVPYDLVVDITNMGEVPAMYTSLELSVDDDAEIYFCETTAAGDPLCEYGDGPAIRNFGHIMPGATASATFSIKPGKSGFISSCMAIADQNIDLQVLVGAIGCIVGHNPPSQNVSDGVPTVTVVPAPNAFGIHEDAPVVAFFSEKMNEETIFTGAGGTFNVFTSGEELVPGQLRFETMNQGTDQEKTVAIWQVNDGITNRLKSNATYTIVLSPDILDRQGYGLSAKYQSQFTTTDTGLNDITPPSVSMSIEPPVNPNAVLPGQVVNVNIYASDQGSGVARVELRLKDLNVVDSLYQLVGQESLLAGDQPPYILAIDSAKLVAGHLYQLMGTAYDMMENAQNATISMLVLATADPPVITLPADLPDEVLHGISVTIAPEISGGVNLVEYFLDGATTPFKTVTLAPWQGVLSTLGLTLGTHTIRVLATDGLGQTGEAFYTFDLIENLNMPVVGFSGLVDGSQYVQGDQVVVNGTADDPVGIASISYYLDGTGGTLLYTGTAPISLDLSGLSLGDHTITILATNNLNIQNDPNDPDSVFGFKVVQAPSGPPPQAPIITSVSHPLNGLVTIIGTSVSGARIDVNNLDLGIESSFSADASGDFTIEIPGEVGHTVVLVAYDFATSDQASNPVSIILTPAPVLQSLSAAPNTLNFTAVNETHDVVITGHYDDGSSADLTTEVDFTANPSGVVSVSNTGTVVALKAGATIITATIGSHHVDIDVTADILTLTHISVAPETLNFITTGQSGQLVVTGHYNDGSSQVLNTNLTYITGNPSVAAVGSGGLVTAAGSGATQVSVSYPDLEALAVPVTVNMALDQAPEITGLSAPSGAEPGDNLAIQVNAGDDFGISQILIRLMAGLTELDSELRTFSSGQTAVTADVTLTVPVSVASGSTLTVSATATDSIGQTDTENANLNVNDITAPLVEILSPATGTQYNPGDQVSVTVRSSDTVGVSRITLNTSGAHVFQQSQDYAPVQEQVDEIFNFTIPAAASGDIVLQAEAHDAAGNTRQSTTKTIEVTGSDITAPQTEVTSVSNPGNSSTVTVFYEITDGSWDLDHIEIYFRRNGIGTFNRYTMPESADANERSGIFHPQTATTGEVVFDATRMGGNGSYEFYSVGVDNADNREAAPDPADSIDNVINDPSYTVTEISTNLMIDVGDNSYDGQNLRIDGANVTVNGVHTFGNVELLNGARLWHSEATTLSEPKMELTLWTLTLVNGTEIDLTGRGYLGGWQGDNNSVNGLTLDNLVGAGLEVAGSYGGYGAGASGNVLYGDPLDPFELGSGGGGGSATYSSQVGGNGGGRVQIVADNLVVDGAIRANGGLGQGGNTWAGCGSGGAINIDTITLSGSGTIEANGGARENSGGGGRIAVIYTDLSTYETNLITALGGGVQNRGGDGTVVLLGPGDVYGTLIIDGHNTAGPDTASSIPGGTYDNVILRNQARAVADEAVTIIDTLRIEGDSILTHSTSTTISEFGLEITADRVEIELGSAIDISGRGYLGGWQTGSDGVQNDAFGRTINNQAVNEIDWAASYGGRGTIAAGSNLPYGSITDPFELGSGGGGGSATYSDEGGNGGGRIKIVANTIIVDGAIRANGGLGHGGYSWAGCGSGGAINIDTSTLSGTGTIEANGGSQENSGGGGRIAVRYADLSGFERQNLQAFGGTVDHTGGPGTIFLKSTAQSDGDLIVDGGGFDYYNYWWSGSFLPSAGPRTSTAISAYESGSDSTTLIDADIDLNMLPGAFVGQFLNPDFPAYTGEPFEIIANTENTITVRGDMSGAAVGGDTYALVYRFDNLLVRDGAVFCSTDSLVVNDTIELNNNGTLSHLAATSAYEPWLFIDTADLLINSDSRIDLSGRGYLGGWQGDNNTVNGLTLNNLVGAGLDVAGSYGGYGARASGDVLYGDPLDPLELGSGGGGGSATSSYAGGNGGGRLKIIADNIVVDGAIRANGGLGHGYGSWAGCGSGGAINIDTGSLSGAGTIEANGGSRENSGGGGRIAVRYTTWDNLATIQALGGAVQNQGGDGTVVLKGPGETYGTLVIDGQGVPGGPAVASSIPGSTYDNVILRNQARAVADEAVTIIDTLRIEGDSILTHSTSTTISEFGLEITADRVEIELGSAIDISGRGYLGGWQTGSDGVQNDAFGRTINNQAVNQVDWAASYGGRGTIDAGSNLPYGSITDPFELGSGGGGGSATYSDQVGGNGGGRVQIVADTIIVDGAIRANGGLGHGYGSWAGCGSGGAINIDTGSLSGTGTIEANGGARENSGGGGRIAVRYADLSGFDRQNLQAFGGTVDHTGGPGTIFLKSTAQSDGDLIVDGGGFDYYNYWWSGSFLPSAGPRTSTAISAYESGSDSTTLIDADIDLNMLPGAFVGQFLNPDFPAYTGEPFEIIANTENTITVRGDMSGAAVGGDTYALVYRFDNLLVRDGAVFCSTDSLVVNDTIELNNNGTLSHLAATSAYEPWLFIDTADLLINSDSRIDLSGRGYLGGWQGDNNSVNGLTLNNLVGAGLEVAGSYGGYGAGASGAVLYGDPLDPFELGSGGGGGSATYSSQVGGNGGGRLKIIADNIVVDGAIRANGGVGHGGGSWAGCGSGGAINIDTGSLSGAGTIEANGGSRENSGGGGRIAVRYTTWDNLATIQALGGTVQNPGTDGTVTFP